LDIRIGANHLSFSHVPWDSQLFAHPVLALESWSISDNIDFLYSEDWHSAAIEALGTQRTVLTARIPASDDALRTVLGLLPMTVVEWTLHPVLELEAFEPKASTKVQMRLASEGDGHWLRSQARSAFGMSRYFRDPKVPTELASKRFEMWVDSSLADPSREVYVFENQHHEPLGFFIVTTSEGVTNLDLTAIADSMRGQGWSLPVWEAFLTHAKSTGAKMVKTNISAENSAVIGIYPKLGFRFGPSSVAMHGHFNNQ
jgi:RimJ/RimL family protein N-acetyltransferase